MVVKLGGVAGGIGGTGAADRLEELARQLAEGDSPTQVAKELTALADEIDGTTTDSPLRGIAAAWGLIAE